MIEWANARLDDALEEPHFRINGDQRNVYLAWTRKLGPEIEAAERGNVEPLRRKLPHLAKFIHPPKLERGQKYPAAQRTIDRAKAAVADVKRLRRLWVEHYGKRNRGRGDLVSAEEIVAIRWGITEASIEKAMKPSGQRRTSRRTKSRGK